jgi:uncharacterized protein
MTIVNDLTVPARSGRGMYVKAGQLLDIIAVEGHQVGDLVAWRRDDPTEYMSPTHTVSCNTSILLKTGSRVFTNRRNPIFTIVRDDVERHDIIVPCCDHERYARDFGLKDHPHCLGNLLHARDMLNEKFPVQGEQAWNVFMHNRLTPEGKVVTDAAAHPAGSTITLEAEMDVVVLLSACPQDLTPCNAFKPTAMRMVLREV